MRILAIETSCDETAAAVVETGGRVLSNVVASQTRVHEAYRGVVPEIASRRHIEYALPVVSVALRLAGSDASGAGVDAVAVTRGPGLIGSLLVGVETAKALAATWGKPLIPVHHTLGHLHSVFAEMEEGTSRVLEIAPEEGGAAPSGEDFSSPGEDAETGALARGRRPGVPPRFGFPYLGLVVSGGHSSLIRVDGPGLAVRRLGATLDDAPGEAYDKVAKALGLPYPGGPHVDRRAALGDPERFNLPRPIIHQRNHDFSFSGLKTAVVQTIQKLGGAETVRSDEATMNDLCASFQAAAVDVLLTKTARALRAEGLRRLAVVGGVACNRGLREGARERLKGVHVVFPPPILCTDNAAMIGAAALGLEPLSREAMLRLDARAGWELEGTARPASAV